MLVIFPVHLLLEIVGFSEMAIVNVLVQLLCSFLCADPQTRFRQLPAAGRKVHDYALQHLNSIGTSYPELFRKILVVFPEIKTRYVKYRVYRKLICLLLTMFLNNSQGNLCLFARTTCKIISI